MSAVDELYQSIILDHSKRPRHYGALCDATHHAEGYNPLCGDKVEVYLKIEDARITAIRFQSASCAICTASASIMAQALIGKNLGQASVVWESVNRLLSKESEPSSEQGDLLSLHGVRKFPARIKCATLPWHTFLDAVNEPE